jgi:hypothetical protein
MVLKRLRDLTKVDQYVSVPIKIVAFNHFSVKDLCQLCKNTILNAAAMFVSQA